MPLDFSLCLILRNLDDRKNIIFPKIPKIKAVLSHTFWLSQIGGGWPSRKLDIE